MSHWERGVLLITWTVTVVMVVLVSVFDAGTWQAVVADGPIFWLFVISPLIPLWVYLAGRRSP